MFYLHNEDILNISMKEFGSKIFFWQNDSYDNLAYMAFVYA